MPDSGRHLHGRRPHRERRIRPTFCSPPRRIPKRASPAPASTTIASNQIQIQHTQGSGANLTVPVTVNFDSPLGREHERRTTRSISSSISRIPRSSSGMCPWRGGPTIWAVNFDGPVRRHPRHDLTRLVLRHTYGDVTAISSDQLLDHRHQGVPGRAARESGDGRRRLRSSSRSSPTRSTARSSMISTRRPSTVSRTSPRRSSLVGKLRARRRALSGERHARGRAHLGEQRVQQCMGQPRGPRAACQRRQRRGDWSRTNRVRGVPLTINANTQFFFRQPQNRRADSKPIGMGPGFLSSEDLVRGFKVHASVVDPLATPLVAQSIDIETARYDGCDLRAEHGHDFTYTRNFADANDDYVYTHGLHLEPRRRTARISKATPSPATSGGTSRTRRCSWTAATRSAISSRRPAAA